MHPPHTHLPQPGANGPPCESRGRAAARSAAAAASGGRRLPLTAPAPRPCGTPGSAGHPPAAPQPPERRPPARQPFPRRRAQQVRPARCRPQSPRRRRPRPVRPRPAGRRWRPLSLARPRRAPAAPSWLLPTWKFWVRGRAALLLAGGGRGRRSRLLSPLRAKAASQAAPPLSPPRPPGAVPPAGPRWPLRPCRCGGRGGAERRGRRRSAGSSAPSRLGLPRDGAGGAGRAQGLPRGAVPRCRFAVRAPSAACGPAAVLPRAGPGAARPRQPPPCRSRAGRARCHRGVTSAAVLPPSAACRGIRAPRALQVSWLPPREQPGLCGAAWEEENPRLSPVPAWHLKDFRKNVTTSTEERVPCPRRNSWGHLLSESNVFCSLSKVVGTSLVLCGAHRSLIVQN